MAERLSFISSDGVRWTVYPVPARRVEYDDELVEDSPAHLCVEATVGERVIQRRVSSYPADWRDLSSEELIHLSSLEGEVGAARAAGETEATRKGIRALGT
jgi:hypothetical protein